MTYNRHCLSEWNQELFLSQKKPSSEQQSTPSPHPPPPPFNSSNGLRVLSAGVFIPTQQIMSLQNCFSPARSDRQTVRQTDGRDRWRQSGSFWPMEGCQLHWAHTANTQGMCAPLRLTIKPPLTPCPPTSSPLHQMSAPPPSRSVQFLPASMNSSRLVRTPADKLKSSGGLGARNLLWLEAPTQVHRLVCRFQFRSPLICMSLIFSIMSGTAAELGRLTAEVRECHYES